MRKIIGMNNADPGPVSHLLGCFAEILQGLAVGELDLAHCAQRSHEPGNVVDDLPKGEFSRMQSFLCALTIIDVCKKEVPRGYFVFRVSHRETAYLEPSVHSVRTPAAMFDVIDTPLFDRFDASFDYAGKIIRVNGITQGPVLQVVTCFAEILQGLTVEKFDLTHCAHGRHHPRDVIDDLPPGQFLRAEGLLPTLAIFDVYIG